MGREKYIENVVRMTQKGLNMWCMNSGLELERDESAGEKHGIKDCWNKSR